MPKPSYLVRKMQAQEQLRHDIRLKLEVDDAMQIAQDAAFMAALRKRDRENDPEYVYTREKVDARLRQICGDKFQPWEVRYGSTQNRPD